MKKESKKSVTRKAIVLSELLDLFIKNKQPITSQQLSVLPKLDNMSGATIRNYLAKLDAEGMLKQLHSTSGRVPTMNAMKWLIDQKKINKSDLFKTFVPDLNKHDPMSHMQLIIQKAADYLNLPIIVSMPFIDIGQILKIMLIQTKPYELLVILISKGSTFSFSIPTDIPLAADRIKAMENFLLWRFHISPTASPELSYIEIDLVNKICQESITLHYLARNNLSPHIIKYGLSNILQQNSDYAGDLISETIAFFEYSSISYKLHNHVIQKAKHFVCFSDEIEEIYSIPCKHIAIGSIRYGTQKSSYGTINVISSWHTDFHEVLSVLIEMSNIFTDLLKTHANHQDISHMSSSPFHLPFVKNNKKERLYD